MKFIIDEDIPFIKGVFEPYAEVHYITGSKINADHVKSSDALIIRTRTKCNELLLKNSQIKYIASATIGFDHIDTQWCAQNNIAWSNAAGCNAASVAQYITAALFKLSETHNIKLENSTLGIVGVGHVGRQVQQIAQALNMKVLLNDPPREKAENLQNFVSLSHIQRHADIITFHTPLIREGENKTYHLANEDFFNNIKLNACIINTSRGEVIDGKALKQAIKQKQISGTILDVWENEPDIDTELLQMVDIGTPHIAGYSTDGKANATQIVVRKIARHFGLPLTTWSPPPLPIPDNNIVTTDDIGAAVQASYNINYDHECLLSDVSQFEALRKKYRLRREFPVFSIHTHNAKSIEILKQLGFTVEVNAI